MRTFATVLMIAAASATVSSCVQIDDPGTGTGKVVFWTSTSRYGTIAVAFDGSTVGTLAHPSVVPGCTDAGVLVVERTPGKHTYRAWAGQYSWSGELSVKRGDCIRVLLE